ncbi:MAG: hypothetical protein E7244_24810 [Enterocloster citroniae]|nr:hypothetical protein [Enterocloster citroniae]
MQISATLQAIGKRKSSWKNAEGQTIESLFGTYSQDGGSLVDELRLQEQQFGAWEAGRTYVVRGNLLKGRSGLYLQVVEVTPAPPVK